MVLALALLAAGASMTPGSTSAQVYPEGSTGHDISWPQCGGRFPQPGAFIVVGVTGGRALTDNSCLAEQVAWAVAENVPLSFYLNMKYPSGATKFEAMAGPAGDCDDQDTGCQAVNYGYKTADHAVRQVQALGVSAQMWWLDIETMNTWSNNSDLNTIVIGAAIDYFQAQGLPVGIYSTPIQWKVIAGNYAPGVPVWAAGAASAAAAPRLCQTAGFAGGEVVMVQYLLNNFDTNYVCTADDRLGIGVAAAPEVTEPAPPAPVAPSLLGGAIPAEGGFGIAIFTGGAGPELLVASGCPAATAAFYFTFDGRFVTYVPGAAVSAVNAEFMARFPGGVIPGATPLIGKCA